MFILNLHANRDSELRPFSPSPWGGGRGWSKGFGRDVVRLPNDLGLQAKVRTASEGLSALAIVDNVTLSKLRITLLSLLWCLSTLAQAESWGLPQLMDAMAQVPAHEARFTEKKTLALLKEPLESSGTLAYRRPSFVEKHVVSPQDETLTVEGDQLTWQNAKQKRTIRLQNSLPVWAFVESIRATLAGDLKTLQRFYEVRFDGTQAHWSLTLTPIDETMRRTVQTMRIDGTGKSMTQVDVLEAGGDRAVMRIQHD